MTKQEAAVRLLKAIFLEVISNDDHQSEGLLRLVHP